VTRDHFGIEAWEKETPGGEPGPGRKEAKWFDRKKKNEGSGGGGGGPRPPPAKRKARKDWDCRKAPLGGPPKKKKTL